jgi:hypothetical protein
VSGEADLPASLHAGGGARAAALAASLGGEDPVAFQAALDIVTGRPFRRTLLARADGAFAALPAPRADGLRGLHVASPARPPSDAASSTAEDPAWAGVRSRLAAVFPATAPVDDLAAGNDAILSALFTYVASGRATVSAAPLVVGRADAERPILFGVARDEARGGHPWVSTLQHMPALIDATLRTLAPHLDGGHDHSALRAVLRAAGDATPELSLTRALAYAERCALIEP